MRSIRRGKRILTTIRGPATFEVQWKRDAQYTIPLFEEDQTTGEIVALHSFSVVGLVATARLRPFESDFAFVWNIDTNFVSQYSEVYWNVGAHDLDALVWQPGRLSQIVYVDFTATTNEGSNNYTRSLEDADGNFVFPLRVYQSMGEVPN